MKTPKEYWSYVKLYPIKLTNNQITYVCLGLVLTSVPNAKTNKNEVVFLQFLALLLLGIKILPK